MGKLIGGLVAAWLLLRKKDEGAGAGPPPAPGPLPPPANGGVTTFETTGAAEQPIVGPGGVPAGGAPAPEAPPIQRPEDATAPAAAEAVAAETEAVAAEATAAEADAAATEAESAAAGNPPAGAPNMSRIWWSARAVAARRLAAEARRKAAKARLKAARAGVVSNAARAGAALAARAALQAPVTGPCQQFQRNLQACLANTSGSCAPQREALARCQERAAPAAPRLTATAFTYRPTATQAGGAAASTSTRVGSATSASASGSAGGSASFRFRLGGVAAHVIEPGVAQQDIPVLGPTFQPPGPRAYYLSGPLCLVRPPTPNS